MTGNTDYTIRQAAYDLRELRGKQLVHLVAEGGQPGDRVAAAVAAAASRS